MSDIKPNPDINEETGWLPLCSQHECPAYDGKRCRLMGFRPDRFCEPALIEQRAELDRLRSENARLKSALAPFAELREKLGEQAVQMADDGEAVRLVVKFATRKEGFDFTFAHVLRAREALAGSAGTD